MGSLPDAFHDPKNVSCDEFPQWWELESETEYDNRTSCDWLSLRENSSYEINVCYTTSWTWYNRTQCSRIASNDTVPNNITCPMYLMCCIWKWWWRYLKGLLDGCRGSHHGSPPRVSSRAMSRASIIFNKRCGKYRCILSDENAQNKWVRGVSYEDMSWLIMSNAEASGEYNPVICIAEHWTASWLYADPVPRSQQIPELWGPRPVWPCQVSHRL